MLCTAIHALHANKIHAAVNEACHRKPLQSTCALDTLRAVCIDVGHTHAPPSKRIGTATKRRRLTNILCAPLPQNAGASKGIRLFKFVKAGNAGQWEVVSNNARPGFVDMNEDTGKKPDW